MAPARQGYQTSQHLTETLGACKETGVNGFLVFLVNGQRRECSENGAGLTGHSMSAILLLELLLWFSSSFSFAPYRRYPQSGPFVMVSSDSRPLRHETEGEFTMQRVIFLGYGFDPFLVTNSEFYCIDFDIHIIGLVWN